jgi:hypothetical protein
MGTSRIADKTPRAFLGNPFAEEIRLYRISQA